MAQITPKYKLRVDWAGTGLFDQTGAELSGRLLALDVSRGRDYASNLVGKSVAGRLNGTLLNTSEDYSPFNTSSPLTGNVAPDKEVRLTAHGRAALFAAASSEYFTAGDVLDITTGDFSIAFWIYVTSTGQYGIVNKRDRASATNLGYAIELQSDGTLDLLISDGTSVTTISSTTNLGTATWHLCILTADRSGNAQFYIDDGAAEGAASITTQNGTLANAIAFQIGAGYSTSADRFFDGRLVSVAHWGKLLSTAERTFLHRDGDGVRYRDIGLTGDGSALKTSLNAWYDLQETSGNRSDSENSNTLTDTNSVLDAEGIANYSLWRGFTREIVPQPNQSSRDVADISGVGPLGQVNQNKIRLAQVTSELTGTAWDRLLTEAGWSTNQRTTEAGKTTMTRFFLENEIQVLSGLRRIESTETGYGGESPDGRIVFEDRRHRQLSPYNTSQATFTDAGGGSLVYSDIRQLDSRAQLFHIFTVPVLTDTIGSLATLWTLSSSGADSPKIVPGETLTFWAEHPNPGSATDVIGVNAWTTLVENTDYEANTQAGGGGTDVSSALAVTLSKFWRSMKIAITNNGTVDAFLTLLQARGTPVTRDNPSRVTIDTTSASNKRTFPNPPEYIPNIAEAFDWANWHSALFTVIQPVLEITFLGNRDQAHLAQAFGRDISDQITVVATNSAGLGISEDFYIEYIRLRMDAVKNTLWVTWGLSSAKLQFAWTLGTSKLGTTTRLAYT